LSADGLRLGSVSGTMLARVCILAGGLVTGIASARALGPEGRGQYFTVTKAATIIAQVANLGFTSSNVFLGARDHARIRPLLVNSVLLALLAGLFGVLCVFLGRERLGALSSLPPAMLWAICVLGAASLLWNLATSLLVAAERFAALNVWLVLGAAASVVAIVACAAARASPATFALASTFATLSTALALVLFIGGRAEGPVSSSLALVREGIGFSLRAYLALVLGYLLQRAGASLLVVTSSAAEVGQYSIASQVFDVLLIVPSSISLVLYPLLVRRGDDLWHQVRRTAVLTTFVMLLLCILAALTAPFLLPLLFGARFAAATPALWALLPGVIAYSLVSVLSQYLVARSFPWAVVVAWIAGLLTALGAGFELSRSYGAVGAGLGQSLGACLVAAVILAISYRRTRGLPVAGPVRAQGAHVVLSNYPLSRAFRQQLEACLQGELRWINIAELRQVSFLNLLRALRQIDAPYLSIATEDQASIALLPVLELFASVSRARHLQTVDAQLQVRACTRAHALKHGVNLAWESLRAGGDMVLAGIALRRLQNAPRVRAVPGASDRLAYLNCNLWYGLKAGGSVGHISGVANALMDAGLGLTLFSAGDRLLVDERAALVTLPPPRTLALPLESSYYRFGRRGCRTIAQVMKKQPMRFIYQRMSLGNYAGVALSRRFGIPLVLEYNGSEAWVAKNWGRGLRFQKSAELAEEVSIRHAHLVVTVSDVLRDELLARGVEADRIVSYPNCIDPKTFDPGRFSAATLASTREELGFGADDVVATFVGTFGQWHGVDVLAQAIRRMIVERRERLDALRLKFLLVGDGQKMPLVREALAVPNAERYVCLAGLVPQREAPRYLAASDLLLSPHVSNADGSRFFGSPTKLFEYMAMGRGIVASELDQIGEVLWQAISLAATTGPVPPAGEAVAVLVRPGDETALVEGIELLAGDAALRDGLGGNARRLALARYTWGHHVAAILHRMQALDLLGDLSPEYPAER
jgi:O-antigen/teichoic acid export membrane protein/glycosyltransferase involved in cell wall biosynthesis